MPNAMSARLQWAAVWGFCFLLSIVIQQSVLRTIHALRPADYAGLSFNFFAFSIVMLIFFMTFILHVRGYAYLGQKYNLALLQWMAYGFILTLAALYVGNLADIYVESIGADDALTGAIIGVSAILYVAGFVGLGFGTLPLREKLGLAAKLPSGAGSLIFVYVLYSYAPVALFGFAPPQFVGSLLWLPVPEALFVTTGIALFFQAARHS
ncbi:cellulose synthase/poly-beta-1,6-N-acetylglucosamine synthase-like glycosyltransferase [Bradyrhizobium japonicum]